MTSTKIIFSDVWIINYNKNPDQDLGTATKKSSGNTYCETSAVWKHLPCPTVCSSGIKLFLNRDVGELHQIG